MNGHLSILDYLLTIARKDWGYNRSCVNLVFRLVCQKQEDAAFKILLSMKPIFSKDGRPLPSGNFFIRHLVRCGCAPEKIIKFCRELVTSRKNSKAFFKALEAAALYNDTVLTSQIMHKLQGNRSSAKPHLYGPLLVCKTDPLHIFFLTKALIEFQGSYEWRRRCSEASTGNEMYGHLRHRRGCHSLLTATFNWRRTNSLAETP